MVELSTPAARALADGGGFESRAVGAREGYQRSRVVEIGDTIEKEETGGEDAIERSTRATGTRRRNGRNCGKGKTGKQNGNGAAARRGGEDDLEPLAPDGKIREVDLRRVLSAMRDLRDGEFETRLPMS